MKGKERTRNKRPENATEENRRGAMGAPTKGTKGKGENEKRKGKLKKYKTPIRSAGPGNVHIGGGGGGGWDGNLPKKRKIPSPEEAPPSGKGKGKNVRIEGDTKKEGVPAEGERRYDLSKIPTSSTDIRQTQLGNISGI